MTYEVDKPTVEEWYKDYAHFKMNWDDLCSLTDMVFKFVDRFSEDTLLEMYKDLRDRDEDFTDLMYIATHEVDAPDIQTIVAYVVWGRIRKDLEHVVDIQFPKDENLEGGAHG